MMVTTINNDTKMIQLLLTDTYPQLVMTHDRDGYAALYCDDVIWAPPNAPDQRSQAGIRQGIAALFAKFSFSVAIQLEEIEVTGDSAHAIGIVNGALTPRSGGATKAIEFRVFWLLRRAKSGWLISRQIWNNKPVA